MIYKLKQQPSGPMEVWGQETLKPIPDSYKDTGGEASFDYMNDLRQWHQSFKLLCTVKPEYKPYFEACCREVIHKQTKKYVSSKVFNQALSEGILIPGELVGFEEEWHDKDPESIAPVLVKRAILISLKEEGDSQDEFIKDIRYIFGDKMKSTEHQNDIVKQKFTIKRR